MRQESFAILFLMRKGRPKKDGFATIYARITTGSFRQEIYFNCEGRPELWNQRKERMMGTSCLSLKINEMLDEFRVQILDIRSKLLAEGFEANALQIKQRYFNPLKHTMMLIAGLGDYVQRRQAEVGVRITQRTADKYERLLRYLKQYLAQRGPEEDIPVERMNYEFLDGFSLFLQTAHRCRHNGAVAVMDCLRNFVLYCLRNEWIAKNPFRYYKLKEELAKAETELAQTRREIKTDKLKGVAVDATTKAVERIGALFHDPKPARYEKQIADLRDVIEGKDRDIKSLQREIATIQAGHDKEKDEIKQRMYEAVKALMRVDELCPYVKGLLKWENYCKNVGLDKEGTRALFTMQPYRYTGELHSIKYNHTFKANDVVLQLKPDKDGPSGFRFTINGKDDDVWFKQQRKEFYERIGIDIERTEQRQGMKI